MGESNSPSTNLTVVKGAIASGTYASSWGVADTKLKDGLKVFIDASITTGNAVYRGSQADVTISDTPQALPGAGTVDCWMIDYAVSTGTTVTTCDANVKVIEIRNMAANSAGKQFKFRILALLGTSPSTISLATTKTSANTDIDSSTSVKSVTRTTTWTGIGSNGH